MKARLVSGSWLAPKWEIRQTPGDPPLDPRLVFPRVAIPGLPEVGAAYRIMGLSFEKLALLPDPVVTVEGRVERLPNPAPLPPGVASTSADSVTVLQEHVAILRSALYSILACHRSGRATRLCAQCEELAAMARAVTTKTPDHDRKTEGR